MDRFFRPVGTHLTLLQAGTPACRYLIVYAARSVVSDRLFRVLQTSFGLLIPRPATTKVLQNRRCSKLLEGLAGSGVRTVF